MIDRADYLKEYGVELEPKEETIPEPKADSVDKMRERLEIRRLELELSKLEKPDTSIDYYSKMLELQEKSFSQQLEMLKQQGDLKVEIEKLKLLGEGDTDNMLPYLQMLAPLLPEIIKSKGAKPGAAKTPLNNQKEVIGEMETPTTAGELEEYKAAISRGEIGLEEAYADFLETPLSDMLTKEQFEIKFNELIAKEEEKPVEKEEEEKGKDI